MVSVVTYGNEVLCLSEGLEDEGSEPRGARVISIPEGAVGAVVAAVQKLSLVTWEIIDIVAKTSCSYFL